MSENFGTIEYNGETITLTEQAHQTNRVLTEYGDDLQWIGNGDSYMTEYEAHGTRADGTEVIVRWHFEIAREGKEVDGAYPWWAEEDSYDWDKVQSVRDDSDTLNF